MISGIGTDIVDIRRIEKVVERFGIRFPQRLLGPEELKEYELLQTKDKGRFLAKRFSVKEAAAKALGTGFRGGVVLNNFTLGHDDIGKPLLFLSGAAKTIAEEKEINNFHVSLSDEKNYLIAYVIMEKSL